MSKNTKRELTPYEQELKNAIVKVREYKQIAEANIVALFYKDMDLMYSYSNLTLEDFNENMWRVYWQVAHDIVFKEKKVLDDMTVGFYLEKHPKLKEKFEEYGGYQKVIDAGEYVNEGNIDGYVIELQKWKVVINLLKDKYPVYDRISEFADMTVSQIYDEYEAKLNHIFATAESDIKSYSLDHNIDELIDELDEGLALGLPYSDMPIYTRETGGAYLGGIHLIGGLSNVGKSTFLRTTMIPSTLKYDEPFVIFLNEDGLKKWQREMLVWVSNNIYKEDLQKHTVRDGKYTKETKDLLKKCSQWIKDKSASGTLKIVPLEKYKTSTVTKLINKYASLGVKHFAIDTFKSDHDSTADNNWFIGQQNMVAINDIVKSEAKNLSIAITFQLAKTSARQRYYTLDNIGVFKNIADVSSTCTMIRNIMDDEFEGGRHELKVFRLDGKNGTTKIPVKLDRNKKYQIIFITKSREGSANDYQIVTEHDLSRNVLKEIGITNVYQDF